MLGRPSSRSHLTSRVSFHASRIALFVAALSWPASALADSEKTPAPTPPAVFRPADIARDEPLQPGDRRRRLYLSHGTTMSTALVIEETMPFHCHHAHDEVLAVIAGRGTFRVGNTLKELSPGDVVWVPRDVLHGVERGAFTFLFVDSPPEGELYPDTQWASEAPMALSSCSEFFGSAGPRSRTVFAQPTAVAQSGVEEPTPAATPQAEKGTSGIPLKIGADYTATLYGFAELDSIFDSTRSFEDITGNAPVLRTSGVDAREQFSVRNSRLGFKIQAPRVAGGLLLNAQIEGDFYGQPAGTGEATTFNNPGFRLRHAFVRAEALPFYVILGQFWQLFGWQPYYQPLTIGLPGLYAEPYGRTAQARVGLRFRAGDNELDVAAAAMRPPQRDVGLPDLQAGLRWSELGVRAGKSFGATATGLEPLSLAISGTYRGLRVALPDGSPYETRGMGVSVAAFTPIIPARNDSRGNTLSLTMDGTYGVGIADQFTRLTGGVTLPDPTAAQIDPGLLAQIAGDGPAQLQAITWETAEANLEYYFPPNGNVMLAAGVGLVRAPTPTNYAGDTFHALYRANGTLLWEIFEWWRMGVEYMGMVTEYDRGDHATNHRGQFTSIFLF